MSSIGYQSMVRTVQFSDRMWRLKSVKSWNKVYGYEECISNLVILIEYSLFPERSIQSTKEKVTLVEEKNYHRSIPEHELTALG